MAAAMLLLHMLCAKPLGCVLLSAAWDTGSVVTSVHSSHTPAAAPALRLVVMTICCAVLQGAFDLVCLGVGLMLVRTQTQQGGDHVSRAGCIVSQPSDMPDMLVWAFSMLPALL